MPRPYKILGISGRVGAGKDTLCNELIRQSAKIAPKKVFRRFAFADPLKEIIHSMYDVPRELLFGTQQEKATLIPHIGRSSRDLMVIVGQAMHEAHPMVFAWRIIKEIAAWSPHLAIVTDVRRTAEAKALQDCGGRIVRLTAPPVQGEPPVEKELDGWTGFDFTFPQDAYPYQNTVSMAIALLMKWGWI